MLHSSMMGPTGGTATSAAQAVTNKAHRTSQTREAVVTFTVWCLGIGTLGLIYLNYVLIRPYFNPLLYAALLSVPLHDSKLTLAAGLRNDLPDPDDDIRWARGGLNRPAIRWRRLAWFIAVTPIKTLLGPIWHILVATFLVYTRLIRQIFSARVKLQPSPLQVTKELPPKAKPVPITLISSLPSSSPAAASPAKGGRDIPIQEARTPSPLKSVDRSALPKLAIETPSKSAMRRRRRRRTQSPAQVLDSPSPPAADPQATPTPSKLPTSTRSSITSLSSASVSSLASSSSSIHSAGDDTPILEPFARLSREFSSMMLLGSENEEDGWAEEGVEKVTHTESDFNTGNRSNRTGKFASIDEPFCPSRSSDSPSLSISTQTTESDIPRSVLSNRSSTTHGVPSMHPPRTTPRSLKSRFHPASRVPASRRFPGRDLSYLRKRSFSQTLPVALGVSPRFQRMDNSSTISRGPQYLQVLMVWVMRFVIIRKACEEREATIWWLTQCGLGLAAGIGIHVFEHLIGRILRKKREGQEATKAARRHGKVSSSTTAINRMNCLFRALHRGAQYSLDYCARKLLRWFKRNMNGLLSAMIVGATLLSSFSGGAFILFKVAQETGFLVEESVHFVNTSLLANDHLRNRALMFASGLEERTVAYLEDNYERKSHSSEGAGHGSSGGLTEVGTGGTKKRALTARELVDMVHKSYTYVAQRVQNEVDISAEGYPYMGVDGHQSSNKQFNSTDQWIELCKSDTNKNFSSENKTGTNPCSRKPYPPIQPSPTRTSPVERGIFDRLPRTGDLLIQIARGRINITSIGYRMQPATDELLEHGMELVENIVGLFYPDGGHGASTPGHGQDGVSSDSSAQPSSPSPSRNAPMVFLPAHQPSEHPTTPTTAPTALAGGSGAPSPLGTFAARAAHSLATATIAIVFLLAVGLTYAFDLIFQWALFLATLYAFVSAEVGVVEYIGRIVGVVDPDEQLRIALSSAVQSALIVNLKLTLYHMLFTYLTHSVAGLPIVYIPVFVTALATLIPIVPWWVVALPAGGRLWWANAGTGGEEWGWMGGWGGVARAVALVGSHMIVAWVVDPAILEAELGGVVVPKSGLNTVPISPQVPPPANSTVPGSSFSATVEAGATRSSHPIKFSPYPASDTNTGTPPPQGPSLLLTGLAFWLGYDQFGFPLGLFLGPLIVTCVPIVMGHLYREYVVVDNVTFRKSSLASSADQIPAPLSGGGTGLDARPPPAFI